MVVVDAAGLKDEAARLGFELVGVCDAVAPAHLEAYERWLGRGFHGSMDYLERHARLKADPKNLMPEAERIIAVGLNYHWPTAVGARLAEDNLSNQNGRINGSTGEPPPCPPPEGEGSCGGSQPSLPRLHGVIGEVQQRPRIAQYARGRDYHKVVRGRLRRLAGWIERTHPGSLNRACVDSAPIMERDFAQLAGLGWFGKNTMIINSERGSWFFIGLLLTSVKFEVDAPAVGGCGTCRKCIDACPTGAIVQVEGRWQVDARRCISYLTIEHHGPIDPALEATMGGWTVGCDVCQNVCPFNEERPSQPLRAAPTTHPDFEPRAWPSLTQLAQISDAEWSKLTLGSATRRVGPEQMRRNARINLANLSRSVDERTANFDVSPNHDGMAREHKRD